MSTDPNPPLPPGAPAPAVQPAAASGGLNVSAWCIRNPIPAVLLFIMLSLVGLLGYDRMKIQNFPDIDLPTVTVTASLPGAAPAQLETEVARKIENSLATVQDLKHLYTKVQDGVVTITAEFRLEKSTQAAVDDVRDAVSARPLRPAGRLARPGDRQGRAGRRADPDLHHRLGPHGRRGAQLVRRQHRHQDAAERARRRCGVAGGRREPRGAGRPSTPIGCSR